MEDGGLVKTIRFKNANYIGDPINAVKIFNEKEADELSLIDISATINNCEPDYAHIESIVSEAFMPLAYGGGINSLESAKRVFNCGVEKVILNSAAALNPSLITEIATIFGSQSVVVSVDVKKNIFGSYSPYILGGKQKVKSGLIEYVKMVETAGAGEVILTNIDHEGAFNGYDLSLYKMVSSHVNIPIVANGGARSMDDFFKAINVGASAVAAGSFFVYKGDTRGILINYPSQSELIEEIFNKL